MQFWSLFPKRQVLSLENDKPIQIILVEERFLKAQKIEVVLTLLYTKPGKMARIIVKACSGPEVWYQSRPMRLRINQPYTHRIKVNIAKSNLSGHLELFSNSNALVVLEIKPIPKI